MLVLLIKRVIIPMWSVATGSLNTMGVVGNFSTVRRSLKSLVRTVAPLMRQL